MANFYYFHNGEETFPHGAGSSDVGWYVYPDREMKCEPDGPYVEKPGFEVFDHVLICLASKPTRGVVREVLSDQGGEVYMVRTSFGQEQLYRFDQLMLCTSSYTIIMNEEQRAALKSLLSWAFSTRIDMAAKPKFVDHPLEFWENMLEDLPKDEAESPGVMHGFCL